MPSCLSFEGCGAAISYHLGVIESMYQTYGVETLTNSKIKYIGTSSGSIAALLIALGLDVALWKDRMFVAWEPMGFFLQADGYVGKILSEVLNEAGPDAYKRLDNRLYISITKFFSRNVMISKWESNAHVKRTVLASCFIPVVMLRPIWVGHCFAVDGGFSNNYPILKDLDRKETVLVSPSRSGDSQIKPELKLRFRDLIGAPKKERFYELWDVGLENGLNYFQPAIEHHLRAAPDAPQPVQTACGRCYFWAMRQPCCMCTRLLLFWILLFTQVRDLPSPL
jgi:predicted acylesterase/phospholipase RssA